MKKILTFLFATGVAVSNLLAQTTIIEYNFDDGNKEGLSIYDEDNLEPSSFMKSIGFQAGTTWILLRDSDKSTDMFLGSTSQYMPAGAANDWLVLSPIDIVSCGYKLSWKSQSFTTAQRDGLKVFISTEGGKPSQFPSTPVWEVEQEESGTTENFEGEFVSHEISLDDYIGKTIYIAFVNQSYNKSIIAIDDIKVCNNVDFAVSLDFGKMVEDVEQVVFSGKITNYKLNKLDNIDLTLAYADQSVTEHFSGLNLAAGESTVFTMQHTMPIAIQQTQEYSLTAHVDGAEDFVFKSSVSNTFPHRIVIEDHTGLWCSNCPVGMWALDSIKETYPNNFVPISVQNNNGLKSPLVVEAYDGGLAGVGLMSYPSGWVNRTYVALPWGNGTGLNFEDEKSWISLFHKCLDEMPEARVDVEGYLDSDKRWVTAKASIKSAKNQTNVDWRIIFVITEDSVTGYYQNNEFTGYKDWIGGWQNKGRNVSVVLNDIARGIYPSFLGEQGSLPANIEAGVFEEYTYGIKLPEIDESLSLVERRIQNYDKLNLIAMLVDGATKRVINANTIRISNEPTAVKTIENNKLAVRTLVEDGLITINATDGRSMVAELITLDGNVVVRNEGMGNIILNTSGYKGVALVRITCGEDTTVRKVIVR